MTKPTRPDQRRYGGRTAAERLAERRARLIEAALAVYGSQGYRAASVKAICAAAGLTERYFYEAFANSEALLITCFEQINDELVEQIRQAGAAAPNDPDERLRLMVRRYFESLRDQPAAARVFLVECAAVAGSSAAVAAVFEAALTRFCALLQSVVDPEGLGPGRANPLLARGAIGGLLHIALSWVQSDFATPLDAVVEAALPLCRLVAPR